MSVPPASADALIACDLVVAAGGDAIGLMDVGRTMVSANADVTPTSEFIRDRSKRFEGQLLAARVKRQAREFGTIDAEALALGYLNDAIYTNMVMVGSHLYLSGHKVAGKGVHFANLLQIVRLLSHRAKPAGSSRAAGAARAAATS